MRLLLLLISAASLLTGEKPGVPEVYQSVDRGRSWVRSDTGLPPAARVNAFGAAGDILLAGTDAGVYYSRDRAHTWQRAAGEGSASGRILNFASVGTWVFAGTETRGVLMSADQGLTWTRNASFPSKKVRSLLGQGGRLYAGTDADGVVISDDGGRTWGRVSQGLSPYAQIFAMAAVKDKVFAGLYGRGLYVFDPGSQRWVASGRVSPLVLTSVGATLVAGHNPGGLLWSDDLGATWSQAASSSAGELPKDAPVWELGSDETLALAGAAAGIYYSEDRGRTWVRARKGLPAESPGVSFLVQRGLVLAGTLVKDQSTTQ